MWPFSGHQALKGLIDLYEIYLGQDDLCPYASGSFSYFSRSYPSTWFLLSKLSFYSCLFIHDLVNNLRKQQFRIGILKNFAIFTGKRFGWSLFFNKVDPLTVSNVIKKKLQHRCFAVNIANFLRTALFIDHLRRLLPNLKSIS